MLDFWMALIKLSSGIFEGFKIAKTLQPWSKSPNCFNDSGAEKERKMRERTLSVFDKLTQCDHILEG